MSSTYIKLPIESGGGGGAVDSFNGRTGIVIPLAGDYTASEVTNVPAGDIIATNVQDAINELDFEKQNSITGSNNQVVYKNGSGDIETLSSLNVTPQLGLNQNINDAIEDASSHAVNYDYLGIDPTENSPDTQVTYKNVEVELDPDNTGFDIGSNGNAATVYNNFIKHEGTSDSGSITFTNNNFTLGNGTDAITVDGLSYSFGFGEIGQSRLSIEFGYFNPPMAQGEGWQDVPYALMQEQGFENLFKWHDPLTGPKAMRPYMSGGSHMTEGTHALRDAQNYIRNYYRPIVASEASRAIARKARGA